MSGGIREANLRDLFAIHADTSAVKFQTVENAAAFLGVPEPTTIEGKVEVCARVVARLRYIYADAMIAERKRQTS